MVIEQFVKDAETSDKHESVMTDWQSVLEEAEVSNLSRWSGHEAVLWEKLPWVQALEMSQEDKNDVETTLRTLFSLPLKVSQMSSLRPQDPSVFKIVLYYQLFTAINRFILNEVGKESSEKQLVSERFTVRSVKEKLIKWLQHCKENGRREFRLFLLRMEAKKQRGDPCLLDSNFGNMSEADKNKVKATLIEASVQALI
jgi:hypothetical protein